MGINMGTTSTDGKYVGSKYVIRDNLILYLDPMNRNSYSTGTTWYDLSGNGNNGAMNGIAIEHAGQGSSIFGPYFDFDGTDDYVVIPSTSFTENSDFTFEMWIRFNVFASSRGGLFIQGHTTDSYGFQQKDSTVRFGLRPAGTLHKVDTGTLSTNTWYHFVGTYDGSSTNTVTLYQNGVALGTDTVSTTGLLTSESIYVGEGGKLLGGSASGASDFNGRISILRIYNKTLSASEVIYNFNVDRGRFGI
jgi:hypothetical protein